MAPAQSRDAFGSDEVQIAPRARYLGRSDRDSPAWFAGGTAVSIERARKIADAVLYEGYVLYPYRASSGKNQVRWQFGVLTPRAFSERDGFERWAMRTECLVDPDPGPASSGPASSWPVLSVRIRCLQVQHRSVEMVATTPTASVAT